jgi:shikimate dehydrogenase
MILAEVIGDPIAQSKSPVIHKYWLDRLGIAGDYVRTRVLANELASFVDRRRSDPHWRGCNVTIPHKQSVIPLVDRLDAGAQSIGAVNCVVAEDRALVGYNTDIDGIAAALDSTELRGRKAALIGAGGAARAVVGYLASRGVGRIALVVRNPGRAEALRALAPGVDTHVLAFDDADMTFGGAAVIINASSLGMAGADPMPQSLLDAVRRHAAGVTLFDLVTTPAQTEFLSAGAAGRGQTVDGLTMLVGQAARAFELFFGAPAPAPDQALRHLLTTVRPNSARLGYNFGLKH